MLFESLKNLTFSSSSKINSSLTGSGSASAQGMVSNAGVLDNSTLLSNNNTNVSAPITGNTVKVLSP